MNKFFGRIVFGVETDGAAAVADGGGANSYGGRAGGGAEEANAGGIIVVVTSTISIGRSSRPGASSTGECGLAGLANTFNGGMSKPDVGNFRFDHFEGGARVVDWGMLILISSGFRTCRRRLLANIFSLVVLLETVVVVVMGVAAVGVAPAPQ